MLLYISHSRENAGAALKLSDEIASRGITVWIDLRELGAEEDWRDKVKAALSDANGIVFVIGPENSVDRQQRYEWQQVVDEEMFLDSAKALIPVLLGEPEMPGFLGARKLIQLSPSSIDYAAVAVEVLSFLENPGSSVDEEKLERGRQARAKSQARLEDYVTSLRQDDFKRAAIRELK